jgi:hypothetical protein
MKLAKVHICMQLVSVEDSLPAPFGTGNHVEIDKHNSGWGLGWNSCAFFVGIRS